MREHLQVTQEPHGARETSREHSPSYSPWPVGKMQKWEKLLRTQWPIRLAGIRLSRLPGAESHDAYHVPEGIEIVLGGRIQVVPQLEHVIWKETNKENCQEQLVCYPLETPRLRVRDYLPTTKATTMRAT